MKTLLTTLLLLTLSVALTDVFAQYNHCLPLGDTDCSGSVNSIDLAYVISKIGTTDSKANLDNVGSVNSLDLSLLLSNFGKNTPTQSPGQSTAPTPNASIPPATGEWTQFRHNAQRTSFTTQSVNTPWKYKWQWNGAGSDGKKQANHLSVPRNVTPITGGNRVYMVANNSVYALNKDNGSVIYSNSSLGTLSATPAYDSENLYIPSGNGTIYKLSASNGSMTGQLSIGGSLNFAPLIAGNNVYIVSSTGTLTAINKSSMAKVWQYSAGSPGVTTAAYSASRNLIVFNSQDLSVHAVDSNTGALKWKVKPTTRNYQAGVVEFDNGWPVIAEQHGIVFVRLRLEWDTLWTWNPYPNNNAAIRSNLESNSGVQALFALRLDNGSKAFTPAVGNGGAGDGGNLPMGPQPVIRVVNGQEVAYMIFRNGLTCAAKDSCDGREDGAMGEMVLDNTTISGYQAGDMRFIQYEDIQTDEMMNLSMSGDILFHSHWLINAAEKITDRSPGLGATFTNPIKTSHAPYVIWRQVYCAPGNSNCNPVIYPGGSGYSYGPSNCPFNATTRYCAQGLYSYGDKRDYPAGFYEYHNDNNSGTQAHTIVSNGLVLVKTNDGALMALESGNPGANLLSEPDLALANPKKVLGLQAPPIINYRQAKNYVGKNIIAEGLVRSVVSNLPKAVYIGFKNPHDGELLVRVFNKDIHKFNYDLSTLKNKQVHIKGFVTLYWPDGVDPEITVTDPSQIEILN